MKTLAILPNLPYGDTVVVTEKIIEMFADESVRLILPDYTKKYLKNIQNVSFASDDYLMEECDIVIAVGGDGTVTSYASDAAKHNKPILGINAGHLGFLSGLEKNELSSLSCLLTGEYKIKQRIMLRAAVFDEQGNVLSSEYCVNDAFIGRAHHSRMVDLRVELDNKLLSDYRADGVIIATPTGSTAYSMSAGGPVVDPHIECMIVTPVCSHSLTARSVVCSSESTIVIKNHSSANDVRPIALITDSKEAIEIPYGGKVEIKKAEIPVSFISIKKQSFYEVLKEKMIERNH